MRPAAPALVVAFLVVGTAGCSEQEFEPPDRERQVQEAEDLYNAQRFDTVSWASDSARALAGNSVYAAECRQCHGPLGRGETDYVRERGFEVPSLVEADWEFAQDLDGVRRRIFIGHPTGMPTWGVAGISPREIDASAFYLIEVLRPEILEGGAAAPGDGGGERGSSGG